jgi:hypothetical protein
VGSGSLDNEDALAYKGCCARGGKYKVTQKTGTLKKSKHVKHFYGDSTLFTVPLIHDY